MHSGIQAFKHSGIQAFRYCTINLNLVLLIILFLNTNAKTSAQNKRDYKWLFGVHYHVEEKYVDGNIIDFNNGGRIDTMRWFDTVADHNAEISDLEGNLLFYFNGCRVIDSTFQLMENGDSINYGKTWENYCGNWARYPGPQNSIILPDPGYTDGYYIIHKREELQYESTLEVVSELLYSYIDMQGNEGRGRVVEKNVTIFKTTDIVSGYLSACRHANGEDWWLVQMQDDSSVYFKILLTEETITAVDSQNIVEGPVFSPNSGVGQAKFSPDGTKWITNGAEDQCLIYDFNRETGELSNLVRVMPQDSGIFYGLAISPNSRFAYLSNDYDLFQVDLWAADIPGSLTHIAHIDSFPDPIFWSHFGQAQLAPDCKIYIVSSAMNNYLHVINKPNEKGKACDFRQHSLYLPHRNFFNSIPNFPHFRMDEEEICDPTITSVFGKAVWYRRDLKVWPNPLSGVFNVELPMVGKGQLIVFDMNGQIVHDIEVTNFDDPFQNINISHIPVGRYHVEFWPKEAMHSPVDLESSGEYNRSRVFYGAQVVKVE